jgi:hypothetical protein
MSPRDDDTIDDTEDEEGVCTECGSVTEMGYSKDSWGVEVPVIEICLQCDWVS